MATGYVLVVQVVPIGCSVVGCRQHADDGDCMCDAYLHALNGAAGNDDRDRDREEEDMD
jgi:transcriptional regulator of met regulon